VALERGDLVCVNHRITALLASYFDILFAVNRLYHPGEKRQVAYVLAKCPKRPPDVQSQVNELLLAIAPKEESKVLDRVNNLLDGLDTLLLAERLIDSK
jgi:hypothetical protein